MIKKIVTLSRTRLEIARELDLQFPSLAREYFRWGKILPMAGQSLGPVFQSSREAAQHVFDLQMDHLHEPHWTTYDLSFTEVKEGNWFGCDLDPVALKAAGKLLGFDDSEAFCFGRGLSENLTLLLTAFYRPKVDGHQKILYLGSDFSSDQHVIDSVIAGKCQTLRDFGIPIQKPDEYKIAMKPNDKGIYDEEVIIQHIKEHAASISLVMLSEIVFNTGQRLDIQKIMDGIRETIAEHHIVVGLDLAHVVGNRPTCLKDYGVHFAVACAYKYLSQSAGSPFGWYIRPDITCEDYAFGRGWLGVQADKAFGHISELGDRGDLYQSGAKIARISNPPPLSIIGTQVMVDFLVNKIGLEKYVEHSERLVGFLMEGLKDVLGDQLVMVTPEEPERRGAAIVFQIQGIDVKELEQYLRTQHQIEVDTRPPVMRVMAHALYNTHEDIARLLDGISSFIRERS
jgi:kynureninase